MNMDKKKKVLVWMSGGVDSAVSAYLLLQQWYEVVAGFMKNYADESNPNCHTREDRDMAIKVAQHLGIKTFVIFDFREEYDQKIIQYIYDGYLAGLTPNPDVLCNSEIKFKLFLEKAMELGCDFVATGHYAQLEKTGEMVKLLRWVDETKDQSYFLAWLNQYQLNHSLFPIGGMLKSEVRALATEIWLPNADRKDSQWLCFIWKVPMVDFLKKALPVKQGEIVDQTGKKLGYHDGAWFYTIGQRHGIKLHQQYYVVSTDVKKNIVVVDTKEQAELSRNFLFVEQWHWIGEELAFPLKCEVKIRYRQQPHNALLTSDGDGRIKILCEEEQRAIAPGQVVAAYLGQELIGSGIIVE